MYPKNYNRNMVINIGTPDAPNYVLIATGVLSRANNISEETEQNYYMDGRGTAETAVTSQNVSVSFTGHRAVGDPAQDYILDEVLFQIDNRDVEFYDYDDSIPTTGPKARPNGWKGIATISISDFGSGDAKARQNISFTLNFKGKPDRGMVTKTNNTYSWSPEV